jgi:cell division septation protein DedD
VAELTQHDADDGFHEIQLSGKQLVFLFMATTVVAVVIFMLGVQVGRNVKTTHAQELADTSAVPPTAASQSPPPAAAAPPSTEPPPPAADDDDLSYAKRLESEKPPPDKLKPRKDPDVASSAGREPAGPAGQSARTASAAPAAAAPSVESKRPAPAATDATKSAPAAADGVAHPGVWVVQLVALKDHSAASAIVHRLVAKGYPAFVVSPPRGTPSIYRVQVGRYDDRREAEQVARRLEKEEQFKPWISH